MNFFSLPEIAQNLWFTCGSLARIFCSLVQAPEINRCALYQTAYVDQYAQNQSSAPLSGKKPCTLTSVSEPGCYACSGPRGESGIYHLQLALALDRCTDIELMVVNPVCRSTICSSKHGARQDRCHRCRWSAAISATYGVPTLVGASCRIAAITELCSPCGQLDKEVIRQDCSITRFAKHID
jgi:hypothetical protein